MAGFFNVSSIEGAISKVKAVAHDTMPSPQTIVDMSNSIETSGNITRTANTPDKNLKR